MRIGFALLPFLCFQLIAAERSQFRPVTPADIDQLRDTNIVVTTQGSLTIPGPSALGSFTASVTAGGSTNGLITEWGYTEAPGTFTFSHETGPTNLGTFTIQGRYTMRVVGRLGSIYNDAFFFVFIVDQGITDFPPTVVLTSPPNGSTFTAPINLRLRADAEDRDGTVQRVVFYNGPDPLWTSTVAPYEFIFTNAPPTNYTFLADVMDNRGATNLSIAHTVLVNPAPVDPPNIPPSVMVTIPTNGAVFTAPVTFTLTASATDSDGTIVSVTLTDNGATNAVDTTSPYSVSITPTVGFHTVTAIATDDDGAQSITSADFTVNSPPNVSPVATLTGPANGATFTAPATIPITASASDADGSVTLVRFFRDGVQVGTDSSSPYGFTLTSVGVGTYALWAEAVDNLSGVGLSATNTVTVNPGVGVPPTVTLTSPSTEQVFIEGATVTVAATGSDDGSITNVSFYRSTPVNPNDPEPEVSVNDDSSLITYTSPSQWTDNNSAPNRSGGDEHYAQQTGAHVQFTFTGNRVKWFGTKFTNRGQADVYIDSVFQTTVDEYSPTVLYQEELYASNSLSDGDHTIKVVCKGVKNASSTGFFIDLDFFIYTTPIPPPVTTLIVSDTAAPYTQAWVPAAGSYSIFAVAWDNIGLITTSTPPATITVNLPQAPFVQLTGPTNGQVFIEGVSIPMTADASDADGTITKVEFWQYQPDMLLATDLTSPYTGNWAGGAPGKYSLVAKATDNSGLVSPSIAISITITPTGPQTVFVSAGAAKAPQLSVYKPYFDTEYTAQQTTFNNLASGSTGQNLYDFQPTQDGTLNMYEATLETNYINRVLLWSETIVSRATIIDSNGLKNWPGSWANATWPGGSASQPIAYLSHDMQGTMPMMRACKLVLQDPALRATWGGRVPNIYNHVRDHVFRKHWFTRDQDGYFIGQWNNPASQAGDKPLHLTRLLLDLKICSEILANGDNATYGIPALLSMAAGGFKDYNGQEARFTPWLGGLIWSRGKLWQGSYYVYDTSHGERIPSVAIELYRAGTVIDLPIVQGLADLYWKVIWTGSTSNPQFNNFIDGGNGSFLNREAYRNGKIYAGWSWLGEFNTNALIASQAMMRFIKNGGSNPSESYNDTPIGRTALAGNLAKCVSRTVAPPYAILDGVVTGSGTTSTNWTRVSGPGTATIISPGNPVTTILFNTNAVGSHIFRLTVLSGGPTVSDDVWVTLSAASAF